MTARDRRALLVGALVISGALLGLRIVPWTVHDVTGSYALLRERADLLARARQEMASVPLLRDSAAVLSQAMVALAPELLSGSTAAEANADLSGRMNLAASRAPALIERVDPLPDSSVSGRLGRVRLHVALETDVRGLVALLRSIDSGDDVLTLDEVHVEAPDAWIVARGPERLKVEVTVSAWYLKSRDPKSGKHET